MEVISQLGANVATNKVFIGYFRWLRIHTNLIDRDFYPILEPEAAYPESW